MTVDGIPCKSLYHVFILMLVSRIAQVHWYWDAGTLGRWGTLALWCSFARTGTHELMAE